MSAISAEPARVVLGLRAAALRVLVLRHVAVVAVEGRLIRNAVGVAAAAALAHDHVVAGDRRRLIDRRELLAEERRGASALPQTGHRATWTPLIARCLSAARAGRRSRRGPILPRCAAAGRTRSRRATRAAAAGSSRDDPAGGRRRRPAPARAARWSRGAPSSASISNPSMSSLMNVGAAPSTSASSGLGAARRSSRRTARRSWRWRRCRSRRGGASSRSRRRAPAWRQSTLRARRRRQRGDGRLQLREVRRIRLDAPGRGRSGRRAARDSARTVSPSYAPPSTIHSSSRPGEQVGGKVLRVRDRMRQPVEVGVEPEAHLRDVLGARRVVLPEVERAADVGALRRAPATAGPAGRTAGARPGTSRTAAETADTTSQPSARSCSREWAKRCGLLAPQIVTTNAARAAELARGRLRATARGCRRASCPAVPVRCRRTPAARRRAGAARRGRGGRARRRPSARCARPPDSRSNSRASASAQSRRVRATAARRAPLRAVVTRSSFRRRRRDWRRSRTRRRRSTDRRARPGSRAAAPSVPSESARRRARGTRPAGRSRRRRA